MHGGVAHLAEEVELGVEGARGLEVARLHRLAQLRHLLRRNVRLFPVCVWVYVLVSLFFI